MLRLALLLVLATTAHASFVVGSSGCILTPTVNGTVDYLSPIPPESRDWPGTFVAKFDDGRIGIGNGALDAHWVRDHVRGTVMTVRQEAEDETLVIVHADVYMLFRQDVQALYYAGLRDALGDEAFAKLRFLVAATHNHHGPDTSGLSLLNREWYAKLWANLVDATLRALENAEPATLVVADRKSWMFGLGDARDPRVLDPALSVLHAKALADDRPIATLVQWAYHPENTLGFFPRTPDEDCEALDEPEGCSSKGKYITSDFIGPLRTEVLESLGGGELLYVNGAVGNQIGPRGPVWEVSDEFPLEGDGATPPEGAELLPRDFRKAEQVGRELGKAVLGALASPRAAEIPADAPMAYKEAEVFTRLINPLFRAGMAPAYIRPGPLVLGYEMRELWTCENGEPSRDTCKSDDYETVELAGFKVPLRKGTHADSIVVHVRIGPLQMISVPGELSPELSNGLPSTFDDDGAEDLYYLNREHHVTGRNYTMPGVLKEMMECASGYCLVLGLTNDAAGYIFPSSDWRIACKGPGCETSVSGQTYITGERCIAIEENGESLGRASCSFGQVSEVENHYEEVMALGPAVAGDYMATVSKLLNVEQRGRFTRKEWHTTSGTAAVEPTQTLIKRTKSAQNEDTDASDLAEIRRFRERVLH